MDGASLSESLDTVVIISGVALATTQYFSDRYRERFNAGRLDLEKAFAELSGEVSQELAEQKRQQYDDLRYRDFPGLAAQGLGLYLVLCLCGIVAAVHVGIEAYWHGYIGNSVLEYTVAILAAVTAILVPINGRVVIDMGIVVRAMESTVSRFRQDTVVARSRPPTQGATHTGA